MISEVFELMNCFKHEVYINKRGEIIFDEKSNLYFRVIDCKNKEDIICKILEWCSRTLGKGVPYSSKKRNEEWRKPLIEGFNKYLGINFTQEDWYWIYDKLGNAVNHELTLMFISNGYDLSLVYPKKGERE